MAAKETPLKLVVPQEPEQGLPLAVALKRDPESALPAAGQFESHKTAVLVLPHENPPDFEVVWDELRQELAGPCLGIARPFAFEAAVSRWWITRLRQALNASARVEFQPHGKFTREMMQDIGVRRCSTEELEADLEARLNAPPPIRPPLLAYLERELDPLLGEEERRFQEDVDLLHDLRFAEQRLSAMEQDLLACRSATKKDSVTRRRKRHSKTSPNGFIDANNKFTERARTILGEPPLVASESPPEYETNLREVMGFFGSRSVIDLLAALDITNDTWQIRRLLLRREEKVQAAFRAKMGKATGYCTEREDSIDPEVILAVIFHENHQMLGEFSRAIDRIRQRRKRTILHAIKCNASRMRLQWSALGASMKLLK
jgi:hypothetical protein